MAQAGPEAYFASLGNSKTVSNVGPEAYFAQLSKSLDCHLSDGTDDDTSDDESSEVFNEDNGPAAAEDSEEEATVGQEAPLATPAASTPLAAPAGVPANTDLEGKLWRKFKKAGSAAAKSFVATGKADRAAKKKAKLQAWKEEEEAEKKGAAAPDLSTPADKAVMVGAAPTSSTAASPLPVASRALVRMLSTLIHQDINTALPELSSAVLNAADISNARYANLAMAAMIGQLRLAVESRTENSMDMDKFVKASRTTSVKKSALDSKTFENLRNIIAVLATTLNTMCTRPGEDGTRCAIVEGENIGHALVAMLDKAYLLNQKSVLTESHPVVRLGALLTSLLGMTYGRATHQTEMNAGVYAAVKPIWSAPLAKETLHATIRNLYE